ncbi:Calcyclin-binding protein [Caligus rogercresseyi]|uniref:Calcyclin-binding protein n=1 Tax=Caligus rogercresseyi TaxID=217165 RepID=A0A7T8GPK7_CALRO|nr:Calcyclin-binding protein [Caligus rogercresseyi]
MESKLSELRLDAKELKTVLESVSRPKVKDLLTLDLRKLETDIIQIEDALKSSQSSSSSSGPKSVGIVPNSLSVKAYDVQIKNYSWEDAEETVKIYIMNLKDVTSLSKPGDILCEFTKNSVHLRINNLGGKNHVFTLKETSELIDPEKSSYKLKSDMVILTLAKAGSTESGRS